MAYVLYIFLLLSSTSVVCGVIVVLQFADSALNLCNTFQ